MRHRRLYGRALYGIAVVGCLVASACSEPTHVGEDLRPARAALYTGMAQGAAPLGAGRALVDGEGGLFVVTREGGEPARIGEAGELGTILAFAPLEGATLVAGSEGLALVGADGMFTPPLADVLGAGERVSSLASVARTGHAPDVWLATDVGVYLYRDLALRPITLAGRDLAGALLAPSGTGAVWVVAEDAIIRVAAAGDGFEGSAVEGLGELRGLASDEDGRAWLATASGLVAVSRSLDVLRFGTPASASAVFASTEGADAWVVSDEGLFHALGDTVRRVVGVEGSVAGAGPDGQLFVTLASGVELVRARRDVTLHGIPSERLVETVEVAIEAEAPETASARVFVDSVPHGVEGLAFTLDPLALGLGAHRVDVRVAWTDGTLEVRRVLDLEVAASVTWSEHIQPLYVEQCADCHGAAGPSPTRLDAREGWEMHIDRILENVREGRMPLGRPALSPAQIGLIETWSRSGFPE